MTLTVDNIFSNRVNTHVASGLCFQPARFTTLSLAHHTPASNFRSTTSHWFGSLLKKSAYYSVKSAFRSPFYLLFFINDAQKTLTLFEAGLLKDFFL